ncbi:MAG TPA: molybdopterin-dependent oxidoreductase [Terriglobia bacterium]|nr:molybdopterin-dependent oxidoreductase [Terriglobia bacterium]
MQRRDFIKISTVTGATAALATCGHPEHQLIRFVPEEDLVPGVASWKPSICTLCPAGCGLVVKVMEGEAEVVRNGRLGLIKMGLAKKLEGNPNHPINQGKLCPRGQAGLQITYNPDRIKTPLKRSGPRGSGQFREVSWDDAMKELVSELKTLQSNHEEGALAFLTKPLRGQRRELIQRFLEAFGAPPPVTVELLDDAALRRANQLSFGYAQLPTPDLARTNYVISFGADFLGTWNSPVAQAIGYGQMRQGRAGQRAKFVQVEARMSQTGSNADEWIPAQPGSEGVLALGLAHVIIGEKLRPGSAGGSAGALIPTWAEGLPAYTPEQVERKTGVPATTVARLARELAVHAPSVAIAGGVALAQTNGVATALAVNALNALLGSVERPGGVFFTPQPRLGSPKPRLDSPQCVGSYQSFFRLTERITAPHWGLSGVSSAPMPTADREMLQHNSVQVLLLYEANPAYLTPTSVAEIFQYVPFIASFGSFIDDTSVLADLILPDHSFLESWLDDIPESGTTQAVVSFASPVMRPLHNTRAMPDVLLEVGHQLGGSVASAIPWKTFEDMLRETYAGLSRQKGSIDTHDAKQFWDKMQEDGGWWSAEVEASPAPGPGLRRPFDKFAEAHFEPEEKGFSFFFIPYPSPLLYDGSLAHLPWLQETPDPLSTAMWGSWVEINPRTAEHLGIQQGDLVEVASRDAKIEAPALLSPGIAEDVVAMPMGQGHDNFGRYASHRGVNPVRILYALSDGETGALAWAATRVKIARVGEGKLILFGAELREKHEQHR